MKVAFKLGNEVEAGRVLRCTLEKAELAMKGLSVEMWMLKAIPVKAQKQKRS